LRHEQNERGAESGAVGAKSGAFDDDLQAVVDAWPELPVDVKGSILAMVRAASRDEP
jgi:hypothetical protein